MREAVELRAAPRQEQPLIAVPVVSWASAGKAADYPDLCNQIEELVETDCKDPNSFALILEGDSMEPTFLAGDIVIFAPNSEARNGDFSSSGSSNARRPFPAFAGPGQRQDRSVEP